MTKIIRILVLFTIVSCSKQTQVDKDTDFAVASAKPKPELVIQTDAGVEPPPVMAEVSDNRISREQMIQEAVELWTSLFDDAHIKPTDKRWGKLQSYAEMTADVVRSFQVPTLGREEVLPLDGFTHKLVAYIMFKESSLRPRIVGRSHGEVGFMQLHGEALQGTPRQDVRNSPKLGVLLGVNWLLKSLQICYPKPPKKWSPDKWVGPLSVYGVGKGRGLNKYGKCRIGYKFARDRVNRTKILSQRILAK